MVACVLHFEAHVLRFEAFVLRFEACVLRFEAFILRFEAFILRFEAWMLRFEAFILRFEAWMLRFEACVLRFEAFILRFEAFVQCFVACVQCLVARMLHFEARFMCSDRDLSPSKTRAKSTAARPQALAGGIGRDELGTYQRTRSTSTVIVRSSDQSTLARPSTRSVAPLVKSTKSRVQRGSISRLPRVLNMLLPG